MMIGIAFDFVGLALKLAFNCVNFVFAILF